MRLGDCLHVVSLISVSAHFISVLQNNNIFPEVYQAAGFCRATDQSHGFDSFMLCFYIDTFFTVALFIFLMLFPETDKLVSDSPEILKGLPGMFFHGLVHYLEYYEDAAVETKELTQAQMCPDSNLQCHLQYLVPGAFFTLFLCYTVLQSKFGAVLCMMTLNPFYHFYVPRMYGFTFVNFGLGAMFSIGQLIRTKKDGWYDLYALIVSFPVSLMGWIEGLYCLDWVMDVGGHAIYDGCICVGSALFLACAFVATRGEKKQKLS